VNEIKILFYIKHNAKGEKSRKTTPIAVIPRFTVALLIIF